MDQNMTPEQRIAQLEAENAALKAKQNVKISFKVAQRGGISVYGLQRNPTTLYREQWLRLLAEANSLTKFIDDNKAELDLVAKMTDAEIEARVAQFTKNKEAKKLALVK